MQKLKNWLGHILPDMQNVFRRFPLAILMVIGLTLSILYDTNIRGLGDLMRARLFGGFVLAGYLAVILSLIGEGRGKTVSVLVKLPVVIVGFALGYFFKDLSFLTWTAILAAILYLGNAPFFRAPRNDVAVWDFTHKLWTAVLFTVAGSIIYTIGLFAISEALKKLFGIDVSHMVEDIFLPIGLAFLAPMAWLSMLPGPDEDEDDSLRNPGFISRAVGFLGTWILAPLTLIYAGILILYGVKIIMMGELPKGVIARLVTPFLIIGTLTWLILDPPFIQEKRLARWYSKAWFPLTIPAALLLLVSVFVRISAYGVTPERYLLVLAGLWALVVAIWYLVRRKAFDIRIIPGLAALLLALASIGPWGAVSVSLRSQTARLENGLKVNGWLDAEGHLLNRDKLEIHDKQAAQKARGALLWLVRQEREENLSRFLPQSEKLADFQSENGRWRYDSRNILRRFGLENIEAERVDDTVNYYISRPNSTPFAIKGYDYASEPMSFSFNKNGSGRPPFIRHVGAITLLQNYERLVIRDRKDHTLADISLLDWMQTLRRGSDERFDLPPVKLLYENGNKRIAMHVTKAGFSPEGRQGKITYILLFKGIDPR